MTNEVRSWRAPKWELPQLPQDGYKVPQNFFATPFVTGAAALMMEWGIVRGEDLFLYGQKVKAYLRRGARPLLGGEYPNNQLGFGALCLRDSFPI